MKRRLFQILSLLMTVVVALSSTSTVVFASEDMENAIVSEAEVDKTESDDKPDESGEGAASNDKTETPIDEPDDKKDNSDNPSEVVVDEEKSDTPDAEKEDGEQALDEEIIDEELELELEEEVPEEEIEFVDGYIETEMDFDTPVPEDDGVELLWLDEPVPSSYMTSLAELSAYPNTRSQNPYGTCWAFSTMADVELYMVKQLGKSKSIDYSELALAYFTFNQVEDPLGGTAGDVMPYTGSASSNFMKCGSNIYTASRTLARWEGPVAESAVRYSDAASVISDGLDDQYAYDMNEAYYTGVQMINIHEDAENVKKAIMDTGAVAISYHDADAYYNSTNNAYYCSTEKSSNHAISVVGWDDDFDKDNFGGETKPESNGAWLIRNSWSTTSSFSHYSYFWMSYEDKSLTDTAYCLSFVKNRPYDNNYQYDGGNATWPSGKKKAANVFTASSGSIAEEIKAVQVTFSRDTDVTYDIDIYVGTSSTPTSGTLRSHQTEYTSFAGTYTVDLETPVLVKAGEKYSVVISATSGCTNGIDRELGQQARSASEIVYKGTIKARKGESYVYGTSSWNYIENSGTQQLGNVCIKAFTDDVDTPYFINDRGDGTCTITDCIFTTDTSLVVPDTISGKTVVAIGGGAFTNCSNLQSIELPDTVKSIEAGAFTDLKKLKTVTIHNNIETIAATAFTGTSGIKFRGAKGTDTHHSVVEDYALAKKSELKCTFEAIKDPIRFSIHFDKNADSVVSGTMADMTNVVSTDTETSLTANAFAGENYTFVGWNTSADGTGTYYEDQTLLSDLDITLDHKADGLTLYAQWRIVRLTAEAPQASIASGEIKKGTKVVLTTATPGAEIYYTLDGSTPSVASTFYDEELTISSSVTIKAITIGDTYKNSTVSTFTYTVVNTATDWGELADEDKQALVDAGKNADEIPEGLWISGVSAQDYCGSAITFSNLRVYYNRKKLVEKTDYTVKYTNNVKAYELVAGDEGYNEKKAPQVTITGKGNYTGKVTEYFVINRINLSRISVDDVRLAYNKRVQKPQPAVTFETSPKTLKLRWGSDFAYEYVGTDKKKTAEYDENKFKEPGTHTIKLTAKEGGNYSGTREITVKIDEATQLSKMKFDGELTKAKNWWIDGVVESASERLTRLSPVNTNSVYYYDKDSKSNIYLKGCEESAYATLSTADKNTVDYLYRYSSDRTQIGQVTVTFTGVNDYIGTVTKKYNINGKTLSSAGELLFDIGSQNYVKSISAQDYTGDEIKPDVVVRDKRIKDETILLNSSYYTVTYKNDINAGTATVIATGNPAYGYKGTISRTYKIVRVGRLVVGAIGGVSYDDNNRITLTYKKSGCKPLVTIYDSTDTGKVNALKLGKDYTVSYSNNIRPYTLGKADAEYNEKKVPTVKITGKGNYSGTVYAYFKITTSDLATDGLTMTAGDVVYKNKANIYKPTVYITDANGKRLSAGSEYDKNLIYTYEADTVVERIVNKKTICVSRKGADPTVGTLGDEVQKTDIIPSGTIIRVTAKSLPNKYFTGQISTTYRFVTGDMAKASVTIQPQVYNGNENRLAKDDIKVVINKVQLGKADYRIVSYTNNTKCGYATVTLAGAGDYGGTKTVRFRINSRTIN